MKKNMSMAGIAGIAVLVLFSSCVSKRKYVEAQQTIEQYRADSAQWASTRATMEQNISAAEQKNKTLQQDLETSRNNLKSQQAKWETFQSTYNQYSTSTGQLHQQLHDALDKTVKAENIMQAGNKIVVTLPETVLFTGNGSTLTAKGKQTITELATVLKNNQNVEIEITSESSYPGYSSYNSTERSNQEMHTQPGDVNQPTPDQPANDQATQPSTAKKNKPAKTNKANADQSVNTTDDQTDKTNKTAKTNSPTNVGDSGYPGSGAVTRSPAQDKKGKSTASKSTKNKTTSTSEQSRNMSFTPGKSKTKTAPQSWSLKVARAASIAQVLAQNGIQASISMPGMQSSQTTAGTSVAATQRGYQIVISPKMDSFYQMMEGRGSTGKL